LGPNANVVDVLLKSLAAWTPKLDVEAGPTNYAQWGTDQIMTGIIDAVNLE